MDDGKEKVIYEIKRYFHCGVMIEEHFAVNKKGERRTDIQPKYYAFLSLTPTDPTGKALGPPLRDQVEIPNCQDIFQAYRKAPKHAESKLKEMKEKLRMIMEGGPKIVQATQLPPGMPPPPGPIIQS